MKKIGVGIFITMLMFVILPKVEAKSKEVFFTNSYGVEFNEKEYDYFSKMFYDGYQETITPDEFNQYEKHEMDASLVETKFASIIQPYSTIISTSAKTLKISTSGSSKKYVSVVATWKGSPSVRSYDLIGAYLSGVTLNGTVTTKLTYSGGGYFSTEMKTFNNGFGVSIELPKSGNNVVISQSFTTTTGGTIYASYQHAISNLSLSDSKKYSIGKNGYGNVFIFDSSIRNKYDGMSGVNISV